ncbi:hypothetical protein [Candidatus Sordicultor fermentans]|uniref:hypothetical protein n=1 Tax=Candidatus Sordicultor fermentans TaxID=1953203 RepID=UPI0016A34875|nr:hypothetical protein [Candidatus Atribacteria bacterium]
MVISLPPHFLCGTIAHSPRYQLQVLMKVFFSVVFAFYIFNLLDIDKKGEIALF